MNDTFRSILLTALLVCIALTAAAAPPKTMAPEDLRPGMRGYALTVLQGVEPERFEIEIVGVQPKAMFRHDIIIARIVDEKVKELGVAGGMSGSPVYVDDKLIGALAYGWGFPKEPIFGVTPIGNMLAELDQPLAQSQSATWPNPPEDSPGPRPLMSPLWIAGLPLPLVEQLREELEPLGLIPMAGGGAEAPGAADAPERFVPGAAVSVPLVQGDWNAAAVGTVTWVDGERVLAFGHPFMQGGDWIAPMATARIITVFPSYQRAFKMGTTIETKGAMVGDYQAAIVGDTTARARMIPVEIKVDSPGIEPAAYHVQVVDHRMFTPIMLGTALRMALGYHGPANEPVSVEAAVRYQLVDGPEVVLKDRLYTGYGSGFSFEYAMPAALLMTNRFEEISIDRVDIDLKLERRAAIAQIEDAYALQPQVDAGGVARIAVRLRPWRGEPEVRTLDLPIPPSLAGKTLRLLVGSGTSIMPDFADPVSLDQWLDQAQRMFRADELIVQATTMEFGVDRNGANLSRLPPSVLRVMSNPPNMNGRISMHNLFARRTTPWVVQGAKNLILKVRP